MNALDSAPHCWSSLSSWLYISFLLSEVQSKIKGCHDCPFLIQLLNCSTPLLHGAVRFSPPLTRDTGLSSYRHSTSHVTWTAASSYQSKNPPKWGMMRVFCERRIPNHQKLVGVKMWILLLSCADINDFLSSLTSVYTVDASDIRLLTRWGW